VKRQAQTRNKLKITYKILHNTELVRVERATVLQAYFYIFLRFARQPTKESVSYIKQGTEITPSLKKWLTLFGNTKITFDFALISFSNFFLNNSMPVKRKLLDMRNFPLALRSIMTSVYTYWHMLSTGESLDHEMWSMNQIHSALVSWIEY